MRLTHSSISSDGDRRGSALYSLYYRLRKCGDQWDGSAIDFRPLVQAIQKSFGAKLTCRDPKVENDDGLYALERLSEAVRGCPSSSDGPTSIFQAPKRRIRVHLEDESRLLTVPVKNKWLAHAPASNDSYERRIRTRRPSSSYRPSGN